MRLFGWILSSLAFLAVLGGLGLYGAFVYYARDLPDTAQLADYEPRVTTRLYADDGRMLAEYAVENRLFVPVEAIPEHVRQAFISTSTAASISAGSFARRSPICAMSAATAAWSGRQRSRSRWRRTSS